MLLLFDSSGGATTYEKTGSLAAGTRVGGLPVFTASVTASLTPKSWVSGPSFKAPPGDHPGRLATGVVTSGADVAQHSRIGSVSTGARISGVDSSQHAKTGSLAAGTRVSGSKSLTAGNIYEKTGSLSAYASVSGSRTTAGSVIYVKTGSLITKPSFSGTPEGGTPAIPGRPVVSEVAEELYIILKPVAYVDEALGWPLLKYCEAVASNVQLVRDYGNDWSQILDVDRAPAEALPWLAQLVGSTIASDATEVAARDYIRSTPGFNRGTVAALIASIKQFLTGTQTVIVRERNGGAYKLLVRTKAAETPSTAAVLQAIAAQKPGGITLSYATLAGQDYQQLFTDYATYQDVYEDYATYNGVYLDLPGT